MGLGRKEEHGCESAGGGEGGDLTFSLDDSHNTDT